LDKAHTDKGRKEARVLTNIKTEYGIRYIVIVKDGDYECVFQLPSYGGQVRPYVSEDDIINTPERVEFGLNIFDGPYGICTGHVHIDAKTALSKGRGGCNKIGTLKLTIEDGKLISAEVCE